MAKAEVSLIDKETNTIISTTSFSNFEKEDIEWLKGLAKMGKVKYSITVKYE